MIGLIKLMLRFFICANSGACYLRSILVKRDMIQLLLEWWRFIIQSWQSPIKNPLTFGLEYKKHYKGLRTKKYPVPMLRLSCSTQCDQMTLTFHYFVLQWYPGFRISRYPYIKHQKSIIHLYRCKKVQISKQVVLVIWSPDTLYPDCFDIWAACYPDIEFDFISEVQKLGVPLYQ